MSTGSGRRSVVGFIGLGDQGLPMARAIAEGGFTVHAWARDPRVLDDPRLAGLVRAAGPAGLAAAADVVALCVSTDEAVLDLAASIVPAMRPGAILVNHGTGTPENAVELARLGSEHGVRVLDAPVSGGRPAAEAHTLTTLVGGADDAVRALGPVFDTFSGRVVHLGPAGAGQRAKLFNNALLMLNLRSIADVLALAAGTGTDVPALVEALRSGSAASRALDLLGTMIRPDTVGHLADVLLLDMDVFGAAMSGTAVDAGALDRVLTGGIAGARQLAATAELFADRLPGSPQG